MIHVHTCLPSTQQHADLKCEAKMSYEALAECPKSKDILQSRANGVGKLHA